MRNVNRNPATDGAEEKARPDVGAERRRLYRPASKHGRFARLSVESLSALARAQAGSSPQAERARSATRKRHLQLVTSNSQLRNRDSQLASRNSRQATLSRVIAPQHADHHA